jgi:hypothetical protein
MLNAFKGIDKDHSGTVEKGELLKALHAQGQRKLTEEDVEKMVTSMDRDGDGAISFTEYAMMLKTINDASKKPTIRQSVQGAVDKKGNATFKVGGNSTSFSTFSEEERTAYVKVINMSLKDDADCKKYLPIDPDNMDIFKVMKDGIILCKLINCCVAHTIDERSINKKENMNIYKMTVKLKLMKFFLNIS